MNRHHLNRLLRRADKLEGLGAYEAVGPVPTREFNLYDFFQSERLDPGPELRGPAPRSYNREHFLRSPRGCGSAACAIGHALCDRWFTKKVPYRDDEARWSEVMFGIRFDQPAWTYLFRRSGYGERNPTPRDVARRIRAFVADQRVRTEL